MLFIVLQIQNCVVIVGLFPSIPLMLCIVFDSFIIIRNRCVPVVDTQTKTNKRCIVPDSPADPSDPNYVDPDSSACLAQSVEEITTQTKAAQNDVLTNALLSVQVFLQRYMSDIKSSYVVLFIGGVVSFVLGYIFLV